MGQGKNALHKLGQCVQPCILAKPLQYSQEGYGFGMLGCTHRIEDRSVAVIQTDGSKVVGTETEHRPGDGCQQRNILAGILDALEHAVEPLNLIGGEQIDIYGGYRTMPIASQRLVKLPAVGLGRTQQYGNVIGSDRAQAFFSIHHMAAVKQLGDSARHELCLGGIDIAIAFNHMKLNCGLGKGRLWISAGP